MILIRFVAIILVVFVVLLFSRFGFSFWRKKEELLTGTEPAAQPKKERNWQNWKKPYQISGAILSVLIICVFLNWFYPIEFAVVLKSNGVWFLVTLLVLNIVLLKKTTGFVVLVRIAVLAATIAMILVVGANFIKGGPAVLADIRDFFVEPQHQKEIEKVRMSHKDILASGIDKEIKQLQATAKTRPLSKEELKKVDEMEAGLARIYSKPEKEGKKEGNIFQVKPGEITHTGIFPEKGMVYNYISKTGDEFYLVNRNGKDILIKGSDTLQVSTSIKNQEIHLRGYKTPVQVSVKRVL